MSYLEDAHEEIMMARVTINLMSEFLDQIDDRLPTNPRWSSARHALTNLRKARNEVHLRMATASSCLSSVKP